MCNFTNFLLFTDSQFGHCFSWGEDREQARENLVVALKELSIRGMISRFFFLLFTILYDFTKKIMFLGDFRTIVEHLIMLLEKQEFIKNSMNTGWLVLF